MKSKLITVADEVENVIEQLNPKQVETIAEKAAESKQIFIAGTGRSGLVGKMFAMRLMHIGYQAYVVGETITPSIEEGDLFIVISGSGETKTLAHYVNKARWVDATIGLITTNPNSAIGQMSDLIAEVPAVTKKTTGHRNTIQPLGSQFDQSVHLLLDAMIVFLIEHYAKTDTKFLNKQHANLE